MNKTPNGTAKRSRGSYSDTKEDHMTPEKIRALQIEFEKATGVYEEPVVGKEAGVGNSIRPSGLPEVKKAWLGGKSHRKTAKRRRTKRRHAKKTRGWFW
jgi:hypothetical protein